MNNQELVSGISCLLICTLMIYYVYDMRGLRKWHLGLSKDWSLEHREFVNMVYCYIIRPTIILVSIASIIFFIVGIKIIAGL